MNSKTYIAESFRQNSKHESEKLTEWLEENETELLDDIVSILLSRTVTKVKFVFPAKYDKYIANVYFEVIEGNEGIIEITGVHSNTAETLYNWLVEKFGEENVMLSSCRNSGTNAEVILSGLDELIK